MGKIERDFRKILVARLNLLIKLEENEEIKSAYKGFLTKISRINIF
ncbi:hypothetical protein ACQPUY_08745 [Clostridium nigeriense]